MNYKVIVTICILLVVGSIYFILRRYWLNNPPYSPEINAVLFQADNNRGQLEKVLKHYSRDPSDSLKLRATEFLIENMPCKYSEYYDIPWEDVATVGYFLTHAPDKEKLLNDYRLGMPVVRDDLHYITAEYLIDNIETAFRSWEATPWGKHVTFDVFCETILPYRISAEPLENWREQALASFADVYSGLLDSSYMTAVEAYRKVKEKLPEFIYCKYLPAMSFRQLMTSTRGRHEQQSIFAAFVMRAMGIPVTCEMILEPSFYERCFLRSSFHEHLKIPSSFRYLYLSDISSKYSNLKDIDIVISPDAEIGAQPPEYVSLAIVTSSSQLIPVGKGRYHNGAYRFASLGANTMYLPVIYKDGQQTPFSQPFFLTDKGKIVYFEQHKRANIETIEGLCGRWQFEDSTNYGKATVGKDLTSYRMTQNKTKGTPSTAGLKQVEGPNGHKAVRVPRYTYFNCTHGVSHSGAGQNINEYTILMDFKLPDKAKYCFIQTNIDNTDEVDVSLNANMFWFGASKFYCYFDPSLRENEWYRLIISACLGQSLKYYLNGELIFINYSTKLGMLDSRFSWSKEGALLFADDDGEDNDIDVSEVAIFNRAITDEEAFSLGGAGDF
ncbi:MAG: hypothetical protein LBG80_13325 [Bacteroidales bacterium]|jgi:hypothetical protein|nr:hypothetical protein [Bacteroidales bacterium]